MFTGIIEELGTVERVGAGRITVRAQRVLEGTRLGDSIAVNGVCLTVTHLTGAGFTADVWPETLRRSSLGVLRPRSRVNLERAMAADGRFGGHIVSGHIDGMGQILALRDEGNAVWITIAAPPELLRGIVEKGSVAIDGVSLTVAAVTDQDFLPSPSSPTPAARPPCCTVGRANRSIWRRTSSESMFPACCAGARAKGRHHPGISHPIRILKEANQYEFCNH